LNRIIRFISQFLAAARRSTKEFHVFNPTALQLFLQAQHFKLINPSYPRYREKQAKL
jgi:hypothetical protein